MDVLIRDGNQAELFAAVNGSVQPIRGSEHIQIYLIDPSAVTPKMRKRIEEIEEIAGRKVVERMGREKFSPGTWVTAKMIATVSDSDEPEFLKNALMWLLKYRCADSVRRALQIGTAPSKIVAAIKNDKPIRVSYV